MTSLVWTKPKMAFKANPGDKFEWVAAVLGAVLRVCEGWGGVRA